METYKGYLFDIYHSEQKIYLWIKSDTGELKLFVDEYFPIIYANASPSILKKLVKRFYELDALAEIPSFTEKRLFYQNKTIPVLKLVISKPQLLPRITNKLFNLYGKYDIYHSDIEITTGYMVEKNIYPLAYLTIEYEIPPNKINRIKSVTSLTDINELDYNIPELRAISLYLEKSHRHPFQENTLIVETPKEKYNIPTKNGITLIEKLNLILQKHNPDIILSSFGDQVIFPYLFKTAQECHLTTEFDRDKTSLIRRSIQTQGTSFNTYGTIVFRAPSYPLFGRWHIDSRNSFVYKEAELIGIIELSRISRLPIQKMARASTGKALTYIEVDVALRMNYLVPWQKSALESEKSALQLLNADKGGLVFQADIQNGFVLENVAQLDFSQMYPNIMVKHNISPETINCLCCEDDPNVEKVPSLGYRICAKRKGIVSEALAHIVQRRNHYKEQKRNNHPNLLNIQSKQSSLKWMLVTSFGYLGYRNAKFGKLESHEAVTAFGREKLINAKEVSEEFQYKVVHGITDSIFIQKKDTTPITNEDLTFLCLEIEKRTKIKMEIEGIYSWLCFPPSTQDEKLPVANRYMGRFIDGQFKGRGIITRRKDFPNFIKDAQNKMIQWMCQFKSISEMQKKESEILNLFFYYDQKLTTGNLNWKDLVIQKSTSKEPEDYTVDAPSTIAVKDLLAMGVHVQAGEKIKYIVINQKSDKKGERYLTLERMEQKENPKKQIDDKNVPSNPSLYQNSSPKYKKIEKRIETLEQNSIQNVTENSKINSKINQRTIAKYQIHEPPNQFHIQENIENEAHSITNKINKPNDFTSECSNSPFKFTNQTPKYDQHYYRSLLVKSFKEIWVGISSFKNFEILISNETFLPFAFEKSQNYSKNINKTNSIFIA
ncbi:DNA-directed DNA polymerase [Leptospira biflexa serovar Patoc strain 'Patoc 1 (Ames)']|uniref:DNA-directed DNA polymerase n=1 Tax=Leptospira biflexa serovar Patoc (strain Patoc 1 / ATCC 23582 / Paris) TaxID=456481 RepID=B0ST22_LEPBP|nr:DNA polymerase domain-containing protein [Leptospira biflexa]ABZ94600.1 DNA-directed DNA polymerase [Leptospira biflexa serovar Patoc strain 'Patoc 1 (Ames)']ABZ98262.1 Putative DNA polymerase [Leptospira biflexa serovar Patoc strain 'Patoc 1 (Paris)']